MEGMKAFTHHLLMQTEPENKRLRNRGREKIELNVLRGEAGARRKEEKHPGGNIESMSEWKRKSGKGELVEFPGFPSSSAVFSGHCLLSLHSTPSAICAA